MQHTKRITENGIGIVSVHKDLEDGSRLLANELRDLCRDVISQAQGIIIDFNNINMCPSIVWGNIIVLSRELKRQGKFIGVVIYSPSLKKAIEIIGLNKYVTIYNSLEEGLEDIGEKI